MAMAMEQGGTSTMAVRRQAVVRVSERGIRFRESVRQLARADFLWRKTMLRQIQENLWMRTTKEGPQRNAMQCWQEQQRRRL